MEKIWFMFVFIYLKIEVPDVTCQDIPCAARQMEFGSVCVCNSTYCDTVARPPPLGRDQYYQYTTSQDSPGFTKTTGYFSNVTNGEYDNNTVLFTVNANIVHQEIIGFGGSFTDSAGIAVNSLSDEAKERLIESYFGINGVEYSAARVPIGCSDFSTHFYTYDDIPDDDQLSHFSLSSEDFKYKIPLIQMAQNVSQHNLKLVGCAFTSPSWMKTNNGTPSGYILSRYFDAWARYHVKFLDAYAENGIKFWVLTGGNEVTFPFVIQAPLVVNMVAWPQDHRRWLKYYLGPQLQASNHSHIKFAFMDDMRVFAKYWMDRFALDPEVFEMVEGPALHWYWDWLTSDSLLDVIHDKFPDKHILYTESSINVILFGGQPVELGSWQRGTFYIYNIIQNINHWTNLYLDWNLALDTAGGPFQELPIDAAIIVNKTSGEFYKNPMFYALGHFSKFIPPGSKRIDVQSNQNITLDSNEQLRDKLASSRLFHNFGSLPAGQASQEGLPTAGPSALPTFPPTPEIVLPKTVICLATANSDNSSTVIVFNSKDEPVNVTVVDTVVGNISTTVAAQSINTFVYWPK
ncbi:lysosomal acid glucosylceramidase-like isoform X3 [Homalodisca vitripennis]|uniref:lysosomal acid glucosylceramidase-like isoform X3 n=1 Tax=Homalodisca vitripennis TaxID=197043 RepID=UPI001EEAB9D1|nr:lysosomal acid glucosylceramidase-like isoform X3 [Homalodisca vitripennis]